VCQGTFDGVLTKAFNAPRIEGRFTADHMWAWKETWGHATGDIVVEDSYLTVQERTDRPRKRRTVATSGRFSLGYRSERRRRDRRADSGSSTCRLIRCATRSSD
jgi:hypothetical protein